jgi:hypothetical protein
LRSVAEVKEYAGGADIPSPSGFLREGDVEHDAVSGILATLPSAVRSSPTHVGTVVECAGLDNGSIDRLLSVDAMEETTQRSGRRGLSEV